MVKGWLNVSDVVGLQVDLLCKGWAIEDLSLGGSP